MGAQFPIPVLSVAADAVRDLQGSEALSGLWTLFTKCKESLQDGRRLENISWRLWYREMMLRNLEREEIFSDEKDHLLDNQVLDLAETFFDEKSGNAPSVALLSPPSSVRPSHEGGALPLMSPHQSRLSAGSASPAPSSSPVPFPSSPRRAPSPLLSPAIPENNRPLLTSSSRRNSFRVGTPINVGQIIYDMLPSSSLTNSTNNGGASANVLISNAPILSRRMTSSSISTSSLYENAHDGSSSSSPRPGLLDERPNKCMIPELPSHTVSSNNSTFLPTPELELEDSLATSSALNQPTSTENKVSPSNSAIPRAIIPQSVSTDTGLTNNEISTNSALTDNDSNAEQEYLLVSLKPYTGPPSPSLSDSYARAHPGEVEVKEVGLLASLSTNNSAQAEHQPESSDSPSTPSITTMFAPSSAGSSVEPPKVVVVNPTPNLTPHPTPPATPLIHGVIGPGGVFKSHFLTLPEGSAGARQHQILEAYHQQQQQQLLGPHFTTLHLPPSQSSGTSASIGDFGNHATRATTGPSNAQHDRSRSVSMGSCDPETSETGGSADGVIFKQSSSGNRNPLSQVQHQQQPQQRHRQSQGEHQSWENQDSGRHSLALSPEPGRQSSGTRSKTNRHSISSIASNQSQITTASEQSSISGRGAESSTTSSTTSSENMRLDDIRTKQDSEQMVEVHPAQINMAAACGSTHQLGPLQPMSTVADRRNDEAGHGHTGPAKNGRLADENEDEDDIPLSPLPSHSPGARSTSSRSDKRRKRNSAPLPATPSAMFALSPTHSTGSAQPYLTSSPGSMNDHLKGKNVPAPGGLVRRASSTSRSGTSSLGKSRSRSREVGIGLGGFNMTTVAAAPIRKVGVVASGRGRSKVLFNRAGTKGKGIVRRNSAGTAAAVVDDGEIIDQELEQERLEREYEEQARAEKLEKERKRMEVEIMEARGRADRAVTEVNRTNAVHVDSMVGGIAEAGSSKRPNTRFNIGSNSDEGKSLGSGSDVSPAQQANGSQERATDESSMKGKGKERAEERPEENRLRNRQDQADQSKQQGRQAADGHQNLQEQLQRRMSGPQLRQLQALEQLHRQQHPTASQQQLQPQQQGLHGLLASGQASTTQVKSGRSIEKEKSAKGKGKEKDVVKRLKNSEKATVILDEKIVKQHIAAPLLPHPNIKRTIVLATTSESEFETDSDDGSSWSDATGDEGPKKSVSASETKVRAPTQHVQEEQPRAQQQQQKPLVQPQRPRQQGQTRQQLQQHQAQARQQPQQQPARPAGVQRTQSSHYPAPNNGRGNKPSRAQQQRQAQLNAQAIVEQAALEAQRQREMFVKLPTSSFQDLAKARTKSGLSILMNPNPEIFPVNHPYRRGFSSGDIRPAGFSALTAMAPSRPAAVISPLPPAEQGGSTRLSEDAAPKPTHQTRESSDKGAGKMRLGSNISSAIRPIALQRAKSSAAVPISSQIVAGSTGMKAPAVIDMTSAAVLSDVQPKPVGSSGYRPRGPPQDEELEDDSGPEEPNNMLPLSNSVAQEKLKAFAQRSRIQPTTHRSPIVEQTQSEFAQQAHGGEDEVPQWARVSNPAQQHTHNRSQSQTNTQPQVPQVPPVPTPIPVNKFVYPYTMPIAAAPTTPRTTRRKMYSTEIPEDLRRDVLWAHKIEREETIGVKRSSSSGGMRHSALGNGLRPLTTVPSVVQLHAKGTGPPGSSTKDDGPLRRGLSGRAKEEKRRDAMARNKSWADDYHYSGW